MVQQQTYLKVADNTGAKELMCIRVLGGSGRKVCKYRRRRGCFGQKSSTRRRCEKAMSSRPLWFVPSKGIRREDGTYIRFDENAAVIIRDDKNPRGTRIFGPVARELREKDYLKILSLCPEVL